ncbi:Arc family DNA-binding protein [Moraxella osloensis]|uniref:Arc family DNA-binding protein n=1 Tax=Faucicola osloensis TaxID=34062 RepID=UPI002002AC06|nr:Arc family DNA-binding protein [Moraxella osloensis]MCK6052511.1 Arc family DNA-binding protein [Moraxella osloensis]
MARNDPQLNFRVSKDVANWLKNFAESNRRSITAQVNIILEQERERQMQGNKKADCIRQDNQSASETTI